MRLANISTAGLVGALFISCSGCDARTNAPHSAESAPTTASVPIATSVEGLVFRSKDGRILTKTDLVGASQSVNWEIRQGKPAPAEAIAKHEQGRQAGAAGRNDEAIKLFNEAAALAPEWPYPVYDLAFTHLLKGDDQRALASYKRTLELAPRGFFTAITAVHYLQLEQDEQMPRGTYLAFLSLEWVESADERSRRTRALTERVPTFAPAWKALAVGLATPAETMAALDKGLAQSPDAETRGFLLLNKALAFDQLGRHDEAIQVLGELALDSTQPLDVGQLAKYSLAQLTSAQPTAE